MDDALAPSVLLFSLPDDVLRRVFAHVDALAALALTCRGAWALLRPARGELRTPLGALVAPLAMLRWAHGAGLVPRSPATLRACAARGALDSLTWARASGYPWDPTVWLSAAHGGHVAVLKHLRAFRCPRTSVDAVAAAARGGHVDAIDWLWREDHQRIRKRAKLGAVVHAARTGDRRALDRLDALMGNGGLVGNTNGRSMLGVAARHGRLSLLKHLAPRFEAQALQVAVRPALTYGHLPVLRWLVEEQGCTLAQSSSYTVAAAAASGEVLKWYVARGGTMGAATCEAAARRGDVATLRWARARGCPWDVRTYIGAAAGGHVAVLDWACAEGCPRDGDDGTTVESAVRSGHVPALAWCLAHGFACTGDETSLAAAAADWEMLEWLAAAHGEGAAASSSLRARPLVDAWAFENVLEMGGDVRVLDWLWAHADEATRDAVREDAGMCHAAAETGQLRLLQWARARGIAWNASTCVVAASHRHLDVLAWARASGCPRNPAAEALAWCQAAESMT